MRLRRRLAASRRNARRALLLLFVTSEFMISPSQALWPRSWQSVLLLRRPGIISKPHRLMGLGPVPAGLVSEPVDTSACRKLGNPATRLPCNTFVYSVGPEPPTNGPHPYRRRSLYPPLAQPQGYRGSLPF